MQIFRISADGQGELRHLSCDYAKLERRPPLEHKHVTKSIMMASRAIGKLLDSQSDDLAVMKNLVGRSFSIADGHYRIVDVQRLGGDALVYAERVDPLGGAPGGAVDGSHGPARTAFHYGDIAPFLEAAQQA